MTRHRICHKITIFFTAVYAFFIILALAMRPGWLGTLLVIVFGINIAAPIYLIYYYRHSDKKEKHRMNTQRPLYRYYYDRWYTPADSTEMD